jgi:hypothetical protein
MVKTDWFTEYPHPDIHNDPAMRTAVTTSRLDQAAKRDRFFLFDNPRREINPHGITRPKASFPPGEPPGILFCADVLDDATRILNVLDTGAPFGVTVGGLKLQVVPAGDPEQVKLTGILKPLTGVRITVRLATCPLVTLTSELLTVMVYPGVPDGLTGVLDGLTVTVIAADVDAASVASPP